jgi:hypothetical protein
MSKSKVTTLDDGAVVSSNSEQTSAQVQAEVLKAHHDDALSGERMILTIHSGSDEASKQAMFVGLNGVGYLIPRGKPWNVPVELVQVLADAKETHYARNERGEQVVSEVPRVAFSAMPAPALQSE